MHTKNAPEKSATDSKSKSYMQYIYIYIFLNLFLAVLCYLCSRRIYSQTAGGSFFQSQFPVALTPAGARYL